MSIIFEKLHSIDVICKNGNRLERMEFDEYKKRLNTDFDTVWIDLVSPTEDDISYFKSVFNIDFSTLEEREEIEHSSRYWEEDDEHITINANFFTAFFFAKDRHEPYSETVTFIIHDNILLTIRYKNLKSFDEAKRRVMLRSSHYDKFGILNLIFEIRTDSDADNLEYISKEINSLRQDILNSKRLSDDYLNKISTFQQFILQERQTIFDRRKILVSLLKNRKISLDIREDIEIMIKDLNSIIDFSSTNLNTLDNIQSLFLAKVDLEQSAVIKIFTIANVIFLPPTLVASIYGMNFHFMPELDWHFGYPLSIILMIMSAVLPLYIFKKKGWM